MKFLPICTMLFWVSCVIVSGTLSAQSLASHNAIPSTPIHFFDIPSMPLQQSVLEFGFQANCEIIAQEDDIKNLKSNAIFGYFSPLHALQKLTANTDIDVIYSPAASLYILKKRAHLLPPVATHEHPAQPVLEEIVVKGNRYPMRYQTIINSEDRYGNALFDSSRAHNILPQTLLLDSASDTLVDALKYISSATQADGMMGSNDDYYIRGFTRQNTYYNGLRLSDSTAMQISPESVERLDVLKGPSMLFYGQSSAGGILDVTKKNPSSQDYFKSSAILGQYDKRRFSLEANLSQFLSTGVDLIVLGIDDEEHEGETPIPKHRQIFSVRGERQWAEKLSVEGGFEHQYLRKGTTLNLPLFNNSGQFLPYSGDRFINQSSPYFEADINVVDGALSYAFSPHWRIQCNHLWQKEIRNGVRTGGNFLADSHILLAEDDNAPRVDIASIDDQLIAPVLRFDHGYVFGIMESVFDQQESEQAYTSSLTLNGRFEVLGFEHQLLVGMDFYQKTLRQDFAVEKRAFRNNPTFSELILDNPQARLTDAILQSAPDTLGILVNEWEIHRTDWGHYLQLRSNWTDNWSTSLGWRYSTFNDSRRQIGGTNPDLEADYNDRIVQVGSSLRIQEQFSVYVNYSETLNLNYLIDDYDHFVERPEKSSQEELGLKWQALNARAIATVAFFNIESTNINSLEFVAGYRQLQPPQARQVQGVELDITWHVSDWLEWIATASISHNKITEKRLPSVKFPLLVADNTAAFFAHFSFVHDWSAFVGTNYISDRSVDGIGDITLGEYISADAAVEKTWSLSGGELSLRLDAKNMLDTYQPPAAAPGFRVSPANGRRFALEMAFTL